MAQFTQHSDQWTPPAIELCVSENTSRQIVALLSALPVEAFHRSATADASPAWQLSQIDIEAPQDGIGTLALTRPDGVQLSISFTSGKARHRHNEAGHGARQLQRALGITSSNHRQSLRIIDGTGGLGQDAWALASLGCSVTVYESHAIVHALLCNALQRAACQPPFQEQAERIELIHDDASEVFASNPMLRHVHAIYLDPMYPPSRKSAMTKKGMQFLHTLTGPAQAGQSRRLLLAALSTGVPRVVVKRPKGAPALEGTEQWAGQLTHSHNPNTRYDIYHQSRKF
ncbi:MAG: class I SAM-dependent methyltransferase [Granulosicoccus sp.]